MIADIEPTGAAHAYALPRGPEVSLRPVRARDLDAIRDLAERQGLVCEELELARLVRSDPRRRLVLCATAPRDGAERVLGIGVIDIRPAATMPSLLLVDAAVTEGLAGLLAEALIGRARALVDSSAA